MPATNRDTQTLSNAVSGEEGDYAYEGDGEAAPGIVDVKYYVNVVTNDNQSKTNPVSITDVHLDTYQAAVDDAVTYMVANPDVLLAEISSCTELSDGSDYCSENPVGYVKREDLS